MQLLTSLLCVLALLYGGGGVTQSPTSLSEFWTDDYKVFEQIYGKTSDRELYGSQLPSVSYSNPERPQASEKTERFIANDALSDFQTIGFGDRYAKIIAKQLDEQTIKPPKQLNFVSADFKPISQYTDPETYNYLKNLEKYSKEQKFSKGVGGFKPFGYVDLNNEEAQAYKSIQDILDAHEANKAKGNDDPDYSNPNLGKNRKASPRKKQGEFTKPRCWSGRCRKRATNTVRVRTRPYVRKVTNRWHSG